MPTVSDGTRPKIQRLSKFIRTFIEFILNSEKISKGIKRNLIF